MKKVLMDSWWNGGGITYLPSDFPNLRFWIEAQYIEADEMVGNDLSDGIEVDHVDDLSSATADVAPSSTFKRPTYETNEINSLPIMRFGGSDNLRGIKADFDFMHQGDSTTLLVLKPSDITTNQVLYDSTDGGSSSSHGRIIDIQTNGKITDKCYAATSGQNVYSSVSANGAITINAVNVIVFRYEEGKTGNDHEIFVNGVSVVSSQGTLSPSVTTSFALPHWMSNAAGLGGFINDLAVIAAWDRSLTDTELQNLLGGISY